MADCGWAVHYNDPFGGDEKERWTVLMRARPLMGRSLETLIVAVSHHIGTLPKVLDSVATGTNWNTCSRRWNGCILRISINCSAVKCMESTTKGTTGKQKKAREGGK
jgi:hypothetical protein